MGRACCLRVGALARWALCTRAVWRGGFPHPTPATASCAIRSLRWRSGPDLSQRYAWEPEAGVGRREEGKHGAEGGNGLVGWGSSFSKGRTLSPLPGATSTDGGGTGLEVPDLTGPVHLPCLVTSGDPRTET